MSALCRAAVNVQGKADKEGLKKASELLEAQCADGGAKMMDRALDGDPVAQALFPLLLARESIEPHRARIEKTLCDLAAQLPIAHTVEANKGFGMLSLAGLVGEAGDIGAYWTVQGLWKRMGVAVIDGERQGRRSDAELALRHGYSPARRSVLWNVGGALIGARGLGPRPLVGQDIDSNDEWTHWQKVFLHELRKASDEHKRPNASRKGAVFESYSKHAANRAKRYTEKMFLKYLWQQWRGVKAPNDASLFS